jgi:hypothetical protein
MPIQSSPDYSTQLKGKLNIKEKKEKKRHNECYVNIMPSMQEILFRASSG